MNEDIKKILEAGITAPSGDNTQPWKFVINGLQIDLYNEHKRDLSVYNWGKRASLISNGAVLENIDIASKELGYQANIQIFPDKNNEDLIAQINLQRSQVEKDPLYQYLFKRVTNRKPYKDEVLNFSERNELISSSTDVHIYFTQENNHKKILGQIGGKNEEIMLSTEHFHKFFFNHINWDKEEDDKKKIGFFIDTLELDPPARASFGIIRHWPVIKIFNYLGFHKMVSRQNAKINSASSGFGVFTVNDMNPACFISTGRALQRFWLTATKLGLSMQPLTGIIFFMYRVLADDVDHFNDSQIDIIKKSYEEIKKTFNIPTNETIAFMFRIGHANPPTARSSRFPIDEVTDIIK